MAVEKLMSVLSIPTAAAGILLVVASIFVYIKLCYWPYQVLKRNGINGPPPSLYYGNYKQFIEVGSMKYWKWLHKEYGPIVGYYLGKRPRISVTDVDLIKLILIKDFDTFMNRPLFPNLLRSQGPSGLLISRDDDWKFSRQTLSPTFSSFKMKAMTPLIQNSVETLIEVFQKMADTGKSLEFFKVFGSFTMETIFATAFGRVIDIQKGQSDKLTEAAAVVFSGTQEGKTTSVAYLVTLLSNFPWLEPVLQYSMSGSKRVESFTILQQTAIKLIQERREANQPGKYRDLLQLMIEATVEEGENSTKSSNRNSRKLTNEEITGHSITFMLAGYETTANALSYTSYLLALNPHIQEKLQAEIDKFYQENPEVSAYQAAQDMDYLDMVLQESLRLYPPAPRFARECAKDYSYGGIKIPKGSVVVIPAYLLHMDPEFWKDPEEFDPLRFTAEEKAKRPQQCYMPFGSGPRSCIGMRFALLEAKIALIELLKRFSFVRAPDTPVPLETVLGITMIPKNGINLKVVSREEI